MQKIIILLLVVLPAAAFAQTSNKDSNYIYWNKERMLQKNDFAIKTAHVANSYSSGQYSFEYNLGAFTFGLPKDYKKRVRVYFIKSASWIDTTYDMNLSIKYQQTLFDLGEVYARQFRKAVYENRRKITWGKIKINDLDAQMLTDFANRRVDYDTTTNFGTNAAKQHEWELTIKKELDELQSYSDE